MQIIPVIDILAGRAVHALRGERDTYRPIASTLCAGSDPVEVAQALVAYCASPVLYVADLDALLGGAAQYRLLASLAAALSGVDIWLDAGYRRQEEVAATMDALAVHAGRVTPVCGTESLGSAAAAALLLAERDRVILSLDRRAGAAVDLAGCWTASARWPRRVIVMTLDRVGSDAGPDLATLAAVRARAPADTIVIGAGGIRGSADLHAAAQAGAKAWLVASALHARRIPAAAHAAIR